MDIQTIINLVCKEYNIPSESLNIGTRKREIVEPRQVSHFFAHYFYPKLSYRQIGEAIGNKDHATVMHSIKAVIDLLETSSFFEKRFKTLKFDIDMEIRKRYPRITMSSYSERKLIFAI